MCDSCSCVAYTPVFIYIAYPIGHPGNISDMLEFPCILSSLNTITFLFTVELLFIINVLLALFVFYYTKKVLFVSNLPLQY